MTSSDTPAPIFHVGLHKTGTTWLEKRVFRPEDKKTIEFFGLRDDLRGVFCKPAFDEFSAKDARARLAPTLQLSQESGRPAVFQDEALAGFAFKDKFQQGVSLQRIQETFPNAKLLVTIREQSQILYSVYGHYLRGGGTATLQNFLAQPPEETAMLWDPIVDLGYYDYARLFRFCRSLFGEDQVVMLPMEWMFDEPDVFVAYLSDALKIDWSKLETEDVDARINPAWSDLGYSVQRYLNYQKTGKPRWMMGRWWIDPNKIASRVDRFTPSGMRKRQKAAQMATIRESIGNYYDASNSELSKELSIDLSKFGYRTR